LIFEIDSVSTCFDLDN